MLNNRASRRLLHQLLPSHFRCTSTSGYGYITPDDFISRPVPTLYALFKGRPLDELGAGHGFVVGCYRDNTEDSNDSCSVITAMGTNTTLQLGRDLNSHQGFQQVRYETDRRITKMSCGRAHTLALDDTGRVLGWGCNGFGQLGLGRSIKQAEVTELPIGDTIANIAAGLDHSLLVTSSGQLLAAGWAADGQTGIGSTSTSYSFTEVPLPHPISVVHTSADTTLVVCTNGQVYGWGNNEYQQIRSTPETQVATPVQVDDIGIVVDAAAGGSFSIFLTEDGTLYSRGYGPGTGRGGEEEGEGVVDLGRIPTDLRLRSITASLDHAVGITLEHKLVRWGRGLSHKLCVPSEDDMGTPVLFEELDVPVKRVVCSPGRTLVLTENKIKHLAPLGMIFGDEEDEW